jgi:hypothetical protein
MDFPQFFMVFLNSPCKETHKKRHKKRQKLKKKRERYLPTPFSGYLPDIRRVQFGRRHVERHRRNDSLAEQDSPAGAHA